jgi:hypothetical protein
MVPCCARNLVSSTVISVGLVQGAECVCESGVLDPNLKCPCQRVHGPVLSSQLVLKAGEIGQVPLPHAVHVSTSKLAPSNSSATMSPTWKYTPHLISFDYR